MDNYGDMDNSNTSNDIPLDDVQIEDTSLDDMQIEDTSLDDVQIEDTSLDDMQIEDTSLDGVQIEDTSLDDMQIDDISLDDEPLDDLSIGGIIPDNTSEEWNIETAEFDDIQHDEGKEVYDMDDMNDMNETVLNDSQQQRMAELSERYTTEVDRVERSYDAIVSDETLSEEEKSDRLSRWKNYAEYTRDQIIAEEEKIKQNEEDPEGFQLSRWHLADKNYMDGIDITEAHKSLSDLPADLMESKDTQEQEWSVETAEFDDIEDDEELNDSQQQRMTELVNGYVPEVERIENMTEEILSDDTMSEEERGLKKSNLKAYAENTRDQMLAEAEDIKQNQVDQDAAKFIRNHPLDKRYLEDDEIQGDMPEDISDEIHEILHDDLEMEISNDDTLEVSDLVMAGETEDEKPAYKYINPDLVNDEQDEKSNYRYINPDLIPSDEEVAKLQDLENEKMARKDAIANELVNELGVGKVDISDFDIEVAENIRDSVRDARNDFPDLAVNYIGSDEKQEAGLRYALEKAERERLEYTMGGVYSEEQLDMLARQSAFQMIAGTKTGRAQAKALASSTSIESNVSELKSYQGITIRDELAEDGKYFDGLKRSSTITRWAPVGCDTAKATIDHELGHEIDKLVGGSDDVVIKQMYDDMMSRNAGREELSGYSQTNIKEFIAEAYSEYRNNPNPRDIACKVYDRLKELQEQKNKGGRH